MSAADAPPAKRKRSNDLSDGRSSPLTIKNSENLWFHDGNVVLQAEHTRFRLHRSVLGRHSAVFEDIFLLPQPPVISEDELVVDGCPLIHLSDSAQDVTVVLEMLYSGSRLNPRDNRSLSFSTVAAMARLGRKYDINFMEEAAFEYMKHDHPTELSEWDLVSYRQPTLVGDESIATRVGVLNLAHEMGWTQFLPTAHLRYFCSALDLGLDTLFANTTTPPLTPDIHLRSLLGRDKMLRFVNGLQVESFFSTLSSRKCPCDPNGVETLRLFNSFDYWNKLGEQFNTGFLLLPWGAHANYLCRNCEGLLKFMFESLRIGIWAALPFIFSLGSWADLVK